MSKKVIIIFIIVIVVLVAIFAVYFIYGDKWLKKGAEKWLQGFNVDFNIGIDVSGIGKGTENALKNMPSINPLEGVVNPFRDAYKNPFE